MLTMGQSCSLWAERVGRLSVVLVCSLLSSLRVMLQTGRIESVGSGMDRVDGQ